MVDWKLPHGPGHRLPVLPLARVLARRLREGELLADLCSQYQRQPKSITQRLNRAGFAANGTVKTSAPAKAAKAARVLFEPVPDFMERGACLRVDPAIFYAEWGSTEDEYGESIKAAKRICSGCVVRMECLTWALKNDERFGVWGGLTTGERRKLRKARRSA